MFFYQIRRLDSGDVEVKLEDADEVAGGRVGKASLAHQDLQKVENHKTEQQM